MGHHSHPVELDPEIAREAIRRIRPTGGQIRMQAPLIKHLNDDPEAWSSLWRTGVRLGFILFTCLSNATRVRGNTSRVPLVRACEIYRQVIVSVSGLARSAQGPSMSAFPGKVRVLGMITLRRMMDDSVVNALHAAAVQTSTFNPDEPVLVCDLIQARDTTLDRTLFFAAFDPETAWLDQLRPAFGRERFPIACNGDREQVHPL